MKISLWELKNKFHKKEDDQKSGEDNQISNFGCQSTTHFRTEFCYPVDIRDASLQGISGIQGIRKMEKSSKFSQFHHVLSFAFIPLKLVNGSINLPQYLTIPLPWVDPTETVLASVWLPAPLTSGVGVKRPFSAAGNSRHFSTLLYKGCRGYSGRVSTCN